MTEQNQGSINPEDHGDSLQDQPIAEPTPTLLPRPHILRGTTYRTPTPERTAFVTINNDPDELTREVLINVGRAGSNVTSEAEALGRLISLALRIPTPMNNREVIGAIVDQLRGIGGSNTSGFGYSRIRSLPDAVARVLEKYLYELSKDKISETSKKISETPQEEVSDHFCPSCEHLSLISEEGLKKCYTCGFSSC